MKIRFVKEKETKNTVKFTEQPAAGQPPVVGVLYVQKWFAGTAMWLDIEVEQPSAAAQPASSAVLGS